ncbi:MAG: Ig-like domain-containing protein, partial [Planctomycetota bacterium]
MPLRRSIAVVCPFPLLWLAGCSSGTAPATTAKTGGEFVVLRTDPTGGREIYLNDPIYVTFSNAVDLDSASLTTMTFQALDVEGEASEERVAGTFRVSDDGAELRFVPRLPTDDALQNGGLRPGRGYLVQLVGGDPDNGTVLRDRNGKGLAVPYSFDFTTRIGTQPAQLFRNPKPGGPARTGLQVSTATSLDAVPLALFGAPPLEVRLSFDQALNPQRSNVPVAVQTDPLLRDESQRGRVFLEYSDAADAAGQFRWIPADVELERNDDTGATLTLRPLGVLPNHAEVRVIVEPTLEDIAGESNAGANAYDRVFGTFRTADSWQQQWNGIVERFDADSRLDAAAVFAECQAEAGPGWLQAGFQFEGTPTTRDYAPTASETVLNTSFTQVVPVSGPPFSVNGGVFNFRDMTILSGTTVVGQGPNPMVFACSGKVTIAGTLTVRGGNGARVDTLQSANYAKAGGIGRCGGGNGGDGTPSAT